MVSNNKGSNNFILRLHPLNRFLISAVVAAASFFIVDYFEMTLVTWIFMWCIFSFTYLSFSWVVLFRRGIDEITRIAKLEDGSIVYVFILILLSSFASLLTVLILITSKHASRHNGYVVAASAVAILLSWMLVHTTFSFHYAHLYYDDDRDDANKRAGGLDFPGTKAPRYLDFAYFSFVIGMTFQVSDVQVTSQSLRRLVLVHGLLSFVLNTFVLALAINLIVGLSN
jgi:uncharacterized membrane protein